MEPLSSGFTILKKCQKQKKKKMNNYVTKKIIKIRITNPNKFHGLSWISVMMQIRANLLGSSTIPFRDLQSRNNGNAFVMLNKRHVKNIEWA